MGGDWKEMFHAAQHGNLELVKYHVKMGIDVNFQHPELLTTALIEASLYGQAEVVEYLLENGADPHVKAIMGGETAMEAAKVYRHKKVMNILKRYL